MTSTGILRDISMNFDGGNAPDSSEEFVTIFQSINNTQILVPELGDVYALQAYLKLSKVNFIIDQRVNAEDMSPDGILPFIRCGKDLVSGYDKIIDFINTKYNITFPTAFKPDLITQTALFNEAIVKAELYYTWLHKDVCDQFTKSHYPYGRPWPLNLFLYWTKKWDISSKIGDTKEIDINFEKLLSAFSSRLDSNKPYIFGDQPCELDTLIYGHVRAISHYQDQYKNLQDIIDMFPELKHYVSKIDQQVNSSSSPSV